MAATPIRLARPATTPITRPTIFRIIISGWRRTSSIMPTAFPRCCRRSIIPNCAIIGASQSGNVTLQRKILFRPNAIDHPNFTASVNPSFNPTSRTGPYDVDNLGNGTPDSIWIDPGFPVMVARDGRTYKVLVAPLILDFDGRLNVNAHGSYTLTRSEHQLSDQRPGHGHCDGDRRRRLGPGADGAGLRRRQTSICMGCSRRPKSRICSPATRSAESLIRAATATAIRRPRTGRMTALRFFEYPPTDYRFTATGLITSFGTPPDLRDHRAIGLDYIGHPLFLTPTAATVNDPMGNDANAGWKTEVFDPAGLNDNPYGIDLGIARAEAGRHGTQRIQQSVHRRRAGTPAALQRHRCPDVAAAAVRTADHDAVGLRESDG